MKRTNTNHIAALASFLGCNADDITPESFDTYGMPTFDADGGTYAVATGEEAEDALLTNVKDMAWAFNADFICRECGIDQALAPMLKAFQEKECESANEAILSLIERCGDIEDFTESAERADGRGHFLNSYDGTEEEEEVDGEIYYIYRTN